MTPSSKEPAAALWQKEVLTEEELCAVLMVPLKSWAQYKRKSAPRHFKLGKHLRFATADVRQWVADQVKAQS